MFSIELAVVEPGAKPFTAGNVNDTYKGLVRTGTDLHAAIIKDLDSKQLANELIVAALAKDLNLPVPDCYLAVVPTGRLNATKGPSLATGERLTFASVDVGVPNLVQRISGDPTIEAAIYDELKKWADLGRLYALDTWIANIDRHGGNLLTDGAGEFWLIDHGHSLTGPAWTTKLAADAKVHNRLKDWLTPQLSNAVRMRCAKEADGEVTAYDKIMKSGAISRSRAATALSSAEVGAAEAFLSGRTSFVSNYARDALDCAGLV
jgi:hypothetical protein